MKSSPEFLTYSPVPPEADSWGVAVVGGGRAEVSPGTPYPPSGHGDGHTFTWETGRVLGAYQLVLVAAGKGEFEFKNTGKIKVKAGSIILLLPGKWHRYRPDPKTGWSEYWIEFVGPSVDRLIAAKVFSDSNPVRNLSQAEASRVLFESVHQRLRQPTAGFDAEAGALVLQLLARLVEERRGGVSPTRLDAAIARAERLLVENLNNPPPMPTVAVQVGLAYSYFRREFKIRTGFSPHQYLQRLRLEKARRVMGTTAEPIKSIADRLGFSSPFHFSAAFKKEFGVSPQHWRRAMNQLDDSPEPKETRP